jgi:hypothetical protein
MTQKWNVHQFFIVEPLYPKDSFISLALEPCKRRAARKGPLSTTGIVSCVLDARTGLSCWEREINTV